MQQSCRMLQQIDGPSLQSPLRPLSVLVFHLLLTHCRGNSYTGQSQLLCPQLIVATVGDELTLPCQLKPAVDVVMTVEWKRSDLEDEFVHVWHDGQEDIENVKHPSYIGRTSLFIDELKHGNISLKLSKVRLSDEGTYECFIPDLKNGCFVKLVVASDAVSSPDISLLGIDRNRAGVILNCESAGWYPEPEVFWLDGEGNLLSAGPTETVRGPDDLYTVSSRVTVEKRHSNSFTCRVQKKDINQTRETQIHIPDDFFEVQSRSLFIIIGLAVSFAVCSLSLVFLVWKANRRRCDETDKGEKKNHSTSNKTEDQFVTEDEKEREQLMTDETLQMEVLNMGEIEKKTKQLEDNEQAAKRKWKETNEELKEANRQLEFRNAEISQIKREVESLTAEVQKLKEEKQKSENDKKKIQNELETKTKELERNQAASGSWFPWLSRKS